MREVTSYRAWLTWTHHSWAAKVTCYATPTVSDSSLCFCCVSWNVPLFTSTTASLFTGRRKKVAFWSWNLLHLRNCILPGLTGAFPLNDIWFLWKMSSFEDRCEIGGVFLGIHSGNELLYPCKTMVVIPLDAFSLVAWPQHVPLFHFWLSSVLKQ